MRGVRGVSVRGDDGDGGGDGGGGGGGTEEAQAEENPRTPRRDVGKKTLTR